jgi:hypothetical protein
MNEEIIYVITFRTINSNNFKSLLPDIRQSLIEEFIFDFDKYELESNINYFKSYELLLNPFKYNLNKIIYIKKIYGDPSKIGSCNYLVCMYDNTIFYIAFRIQI